jgi:hypothetical protein
LAWEYAQEGRDWETAVRQRGREIEALKAVGLELEPELTRDPDSNAKTE